MAGSLAVDGSKLTDDFVVSVLECRWEMVEGGELVQHLLVCATATMSNPV